MTTPQLPVMSATMFRHGWFLILCLLAASLIATASVCAGEVSGTATIACSGAVDANQDAGGSGDTGVPHQHATCHGHNVTAETTAPALARVMVAPTLPSASLPMALARRTVDPALEPPRA